MLKFLHSSDFMIAMVYLVVAVVFSMFLGAIAKSKLVKSTRWLLGVIVVAIWYYGTLHMVGLWHYGHGSQAVTILGEFVLCVFAFGGIIISGQDIKYDNGAVAIREGSSIYWVLTKWCKLDPDKPRTLCSISWTGMLAIIAMPIACILVNLYWTVMTTLAVLCCGMNLVSYFKGFKTMSKDSCAPSWRWNTYKGYPLSPIVNIGIVALGYLVYELWLGHPDAKRWLIVLGYIFVVSCVLEFFVAYVIGYRNSAGTDYKTRLAYGWEHSWDEAYGPATGAIADGVASPFRIIFTVIATMKKRICPKIVIVGTSEVKGNDVTD